MTKVEELIRMIYRLYRKRNSHTKSSCPDEETLVCFAEGRLSKDESKMVQEHIILCSRCAETIALLCRKFKEEKDVPEFLINKAKSLVGSRRSFPNILDIALAVKEGALQILDTTGDVILHNEIIPLPVLRSRKITDFPEEIRLIKEFKDIKATLNIQKRDKDKIRVNLNLIDKIRLIPLDNLRLVLLKDAQEFESYEVVSGNAVFDNIGLGSYAIQIIYKGKDLGVINLKIK